LFERSYASHSCRRIIRIEVISLLFPQHYPRYDTNPGLIQATHYGGSLRCEVENSDGDFRVQLVQRRDYVLIGKQGLHLLDTFVAAGKANIRRRSWALNTNSSWSLRDNCREHRRVANT